MNFKSLKIKYFIFSITFLLTFLVVDFVAILYLKYFATDNELSIYGSAADISTRETIFQRHHYLQYTGKPNYKNHENQHNELGFRGENLSYQENSFRIALLGGSTTYTTSVKSYKQSYPYLLEELLNSGQNTIRYEVINAGLHAYSSWESLINFQFKVLDLNPNLVIIYHGLNDVHCRLVHPPSSYKPDNSGARIPYQAPAETLGEKSTFIRILLTKLGYRLPFPGWGIRRTFEFVPDNYASEFRMQKWNNTYPSGIFEEVSALQMLQNNKPKFFSRNMLNINAIAKEHNIPTVFMTFAFSSLFKDKPRVSSDEYIFALEQHNDVLRTLSDSHDIPLFDFANEFPKEIDYFVDGRHLNEQGARLKANLVYNWLCASGLIPSFPIQN